MKITPTSLSISQLFSSKNEQFFIPAYQRRFSWVWKQLEELFDDIEILSENDNHLLGSIVCLTESHKAGINTLELVDGQQRITSLSILFKAIRDRFAKLDVVETEKEIESYQFCKGFDNKKINKLLLGDLDNPDYIQLMEGEDLENLINKNLAEAYNLFSDWLKDYNLSELNEFYFKLINNVHVIRLDVGHSRDAYKLFETINNRGLILSPTDIIKNFLLGHASVIDEKTLKKVKDNWKDLIINLDELNSDDFFRQYMCGVLKRKVTKSHLIDNFKKYYLGVVKKSDKLPEYHLYYDIKPEKTEIESTDEDNIIEELDQNGDTEPINENENDIIIKKISIIEFSKEIKKLSAIYGKMLKKQFANKKINKHIFNLQRIKSFPAYTFLLSVFDRNLKDDDRIEILILIETFMLRRHICEFRTGELDDIFSKLVGVDDDDIIDNIKRALKKHLPSDEEFKRKFTHHNYKGNFNRAKYVLETLEYDLIDDQGEYELNSGNDVHLEHIIPQTINTKKSKKEYGDWSKYLGDKDTQLHSEYVNRIGNLTLLAQQLNLKASNNPFTAKKKEYKKSNIKLTQELASNHSKFKRLDVNKRSDNFAVKAPKLWNL